MSGLFTLAAAGVGFLFIAAVETLPPIPHTPRLRSTLTAALASLTIISSLVSALSAHDPIGSPLPLATAAVAALFLLHSLASLSPIPFPASLLDLLLLAAFSQELLLFSLRRKDVDGIENRYFALLLAPVLLCAASTLLIIARPQARGPRLARAAGLALHGTWLVQMGFSFFSTVIASGCTVHHLSRANYTIRCKGHPEFHRARAIATLQFNCHLALIAVVAVVVFAVMAGGGGGAGYRQLSTEMRTVENVSGQFTLDVSGQFTLDDGDDDDEGEGEEIKVEVNGKKLHHDVVLPVSEMNGFGGAH